MGIQFLCKKEIFTDLYVGSKLYLADRGRAFNGYDREGGESVYRQLEAVYETFCRQYRRGCRELEKETDLAACLCALLLKTGLHPLLIYGCTDLAVGVWLYEDYNMGASWIYEEEFAEEGYDAGGMLLPIACRGIRKGWNFSTAVKEGCRIVADFSFAQDISLENRNRKEPPVVYLNADGSVSPLELLESDETCFYDTELLRLYDSISSSDPAASSLLTREVRHHPLAAAFFEKSFPNQGMDDPDLRNADGTAGLDRSHPLQALLEEAGEISVELLREWNEKEPIVRIAAKAERQQRIAMQMLQEDLDRKQKTLVLAPEEILSNMKADWKENFAESTILDSLLFLSEAVSADSLQMDMNRQKNRKKQEADPRISMKRRRYEELKQKAADYEQQLGQMTECGKTLQEILQGFESAKEDPESSEALARASDIRWDQGLLKGFQAYQQAQENCRLKDRDGGVYLDFSLYQPDEIKTLQQLLTACEKPAAVLYEEVEAFGNRIGRPRGEQEQAKSYLEAVISSAQILNDCRELEQEMQSRMEKSEAGENGVSGKAGEEVLSYKKYKEKKERIGQLSARVSLSALQQCKREQLAELLSACRVVVDEGDNHSLIKSRAYQVARQEIQQYLHAWEEAGALKKSPQKAELLTIALGLLSYYEGYEDSYEENRGEEAGKLSGWKVEPVLDRMEELFGDAVSSDETVFGQQKALTRQWIRMESRAFFSSRAAENIKRCMVMVSQGERLPSGWESMAVAAGKLLQDSDFYSEALKRVFQYLKIDYHLFFEMYAQDSMMTFVLLWQQKLQEKQVYDNWYYAEKQMEQRGLGPFLKEISENRWSSEKAYAILQKTWYEQNRSFYLKETGFDLQDYHMVQNAIDRTRKRLQAESRKNLESMLQEELLLACETHVTQRNRLEGEAFSSVYQMFQEVPDLLKACYPVLFASPRYALACLQDTSLQFDRIILCGADQLPFYQVIYLLTKGEKLLILEEDMAVEEGAAMEGSLAEKAKQVQIPCLRPYQ